MCADVERKGRREREGKERKAKIRDRGKMWWSLSYVSQALKKKKNNINAPRESTLHRVKPLLVLGIFLLIVNGFKS